MKEISGREDQQRMKDPNNKHTDKWRHYIRDCPNVVKEEVKMQLSSMIGDDKSIGRCRSGLFQAFLQRY